MGRLEVVFSFGLGYPFLQMGILDSPIIISFADTENTVRIDPPPIEQWLLSDDQA